MRRRSSSRGDSLDTWIERVMRKDQRVLERCETTVSGVVVSATGQTVVVETDEGRLPARTMGRSAVIGDRVTVAMPEDAEPAVLSVNDRRTKLSRPNVDGTGAEQVIVANVDTVVIVVSVVSPPLHPRLIDRYLVAIQQGGAEAMVFVNKIDLLDDPSELDVLDPYRNIGLCVLQGSATTSGVGDELLAALRGKVCAFVGHSGVGKSSIVNCLKPDAGLDTGSLMHGYGRGAHTTTASSLHRLADGTVLIDTPGIRSFGLRSLEGDEVASYFPEFAEFGCRFSDCTHVHEPECGVIAAVDTGEIEEVRYDAYLRLRDEM